MAYRISTESLMCKDCNAEHDEECAIIDSLKDLEYYLSDFENYKAHSPFVIIEGNFFQHFSVWRLNHDQHLSDEKRKFLASLIGLVQSVASGNGIGIVASYALLWNEIATSMRYEKRQPVFLTLARHHLEILDVDRMLVSLYKNRSGQSFSVGNGYSIMLASLKGRRLI